MSKKKMQYRNFNICQLIDKGKLKLQYYDEYDSYLKTYSQTKSKINNIDKKHKKEKLDIDESIIKNPFIPEIPYLNHNIINTNHGYIDTIKGDLDYCFLKNKCKFVEMLKDDKKEYAILMFDGFIFGNDKFKDVNILDITDKVIESIEPYLLEFDMIKVLYTQEDLLNILNLYIDTKIKNKQ